MYVGQGRASSGCGVLNLANSERRSALTMCKVLCYLCGQIYWRCNAGLIVNLIEEAKWKIN